MRTDDFHYDLPEDLIAQTPLPRGESRLMVLHRDSGAIEHCQFSDIVALIRSNDTLVLNDTRVISRRIQAVRPNGLPAEALILRPVGDIECEALIKPARAFRRNGIICLAAGHDQHIPATIVGETADGARRLQFRSLQERDRVFAAGEAPLPPYIHEKLDDEERYQTVFSSQPGAAAAPTAGLHFTQEAISAIRRRGTRLATLTLHIGVDTFRPVKVEEVKRHVMHGERYWMGHEDAEAINQTTGRVVAVGTTAVRVLETCAVDDGKVQAAEGETRLFIYPGFRFRVVQALLTNFHLPKSTLLMMVSAFAGRENVLRAYQEAVRRHYRFFSFGDAMLII